MFNSIAHCFSGFRVFFLLVYWNFYAFWEKNPLCLCIYICHNILVYAVTVLSPFICFLGLMWQTSTDLVAWNSRFFFLSHSSEGHKAKVKVQARWVPSEDSEEESILCLSPSFWWLQVFFAFFDFSCKHIISISDSILTLWWFNR